MRILVTGTAGQVARSLMERAPEHRVEVVAVGRPEMDLAESSSVAPSISRMRPDIVVNAAAYTAVDQAEAERDLAYAVNCSGAAAVAAAAKEFGVPVVHLSTDYVFDGRLERPYREEDPVAPPNVYGASKLAGERAVAAANSDHLILRTAWVYSPFGRNFLTTMLRLSRTRSEIAVVADQMGSPTSALDLADGIIRGCRNLLDSDHPSLRGTFHVAGSGETTWAGFAEAIFEAVAGAGGASARVRRIGTADYPTAARRPQNSRLECGKFAAAHGVKLPPWRSSVERCVRAHLGV